MENKLVYVITDGLNYLEDNGSGSGGNTLTKDKNLAVKWAKKSSAEKVLSIYKLANTKSKPWTQSREKFFNVVEFVDEELIIEEFELDFDLIKEIQSLSCKIPQLESRMEYLKQRLSCYDKRTQDILHCAEFYKLDIQKGYKLYKSLHETRVERRDCKNELETIKYMISTLGNDFNKRGIDSVKNFANTKYNNSHYNPRVVDELFDLLK